MTRTTATERIIRLHVDKDLYFEIVNGVQKPIERAAALAALKNVSVMNQTGAWATFSVSAVSA